MLYSTSQAIVAILTISPLVYAGPVLIPDPIDREIFSDVADASQNHRSRDSLFIAPAPGLRNFRSRSAAGIDEQSRPDRLDTVSTDEITDLLKRLLSSAGATKSSEEQDVAGNLDLARRSDDDEKYSVAKRAPTIPAIVPAKMSLWGDTWGRMIREPPDSGWTFDTIEQIALRALDSIVRQEPNLKWTVVAVLWNPGDACYIGSLPRKDSQSVDGQDRFEYLVPTRAPVLWKQLKDRKPTAGHGKYHAEDVACFLFERFTETPVEEGTERYKTPNRLYITAVTNKPERAGGPKTPRHIDACTLSWNLIDPPCSTVMGRLGIHIA